jgi:hypothetical protein
MELKDVLWSDTANIAENHTSFSVLFRQIPLHSWDIQPESVTLALELIAIIFSLYAAQRWHP